MDLETLRSIQTPIKERYRTDPQSALVTLHAKGTVDVASQHCSIQSHIGTVTAGLHPAAGGSDKDACSAEILLQSLVACAGVTFAAVATSMGIAVNACSIHAAGTMDFRGTLGVEKSAPVGLTHIELMFDIDSSAPVDSIAKLVSLTERYCVIYQTLKRGVTIETKA